MQKIAIIGGGLIGSLAACYLAQRNLQVDIIEKRPDFRTKVQEDGRSINLALSHRGWTALEKVGLRKSVEALSIPMYGRIIHQSNSEITKQAYGVDNQAIYSISRGALNQCLIKAADALKNVNCAFNQKCLGVDYDTTEVIYEDKRVKYDAIIGADGAYSRVRHAIQKRYRFDYQQSYLQHGYKELTIPAGKNGSFQLNANGLHIWPRESAMLIALPNTDGSFTCTLFAPFEGENGFDQITDDESLIHHFKTQYPDAFELMPNLKEQFWSNPTASLVTIKCNPWHRNNIVLLGDAAHAIVPFYGQGMNAGFEDCRVLDELIGQFSDWSSCFEAFSEHRKSDADAIAQMALENFLEMRDTVADEEFLLKKKIEKAIIHRFPSYLPRYSLVSFTNTSYAKALEAGAKQQEFLLDLVHRPNSLAKIESGALDDEVQRWLDNLL